MIQSSENNKLALYQKWMNKGVKFIDASTTYIDETVILSSEVEIGPMTVIQNHTYIGPRSKIKAFSEISNSKIGSDTLIWSSTIIDSEINDNVIIGPYAYIRGQCCIKNHSSVGAHSELNDTTFGEYSKCKHFSYLGHARVGINVNSKRAF
jgi:bifunctional UDP-N-acetylglucosamine pyrophosphorylase/glucosamine-1-phosphate N-acetyltransferase